MQTLLYFFLLGGGGGGSRNIPSRFMLLKLDISAGLMSHLARMHVTPTLGKKPKSHFYFVLQKQRTLGWMVANPPTWVGWR